MDEGTVVELVRNEEPISVGDDQGRTILVGVGKSQCLRTVEGIAASFKPFGKLQSIVRVDHSGIQQAFVSFYDVEDARMAAKSLHGTLTSDGKGVFAIKVSGVNIQEVQHFQLVNDQVAPPTAEATGEVKSQLEAIVVEHKDVKRKRTGERGPEVKPEAKEKRAYNFKKYHKSPKFGCKYPGCGKTYRRIQTLIQHGNIHSGKFTCKGCDKKYSRRDYLKKHREDPMNCVYPRKPRDS